MDPSGTTLGESAGTVLVALLALLGPGLAVGHAWLGLRRLTLLASALPLTAGIVALLTLLVPPLGLPWVPAMATVLALVTAGAVGTGVVRTVVARRAEATARGPERGPERRPVLPGDVDAGRADRLVTGLALVAALFLLLLVSSRGLEGLGIGQPIEHRDAVFHYSATALVVAGDGSPFPLGGLDALFPGSDGVYYPSLWHGLTALPAAAGDAVLGSHVVVALVAWAFFLGVALLARAAAPRLPFAAGLAVLVASAATAFPYYSMHFHGQWPWALSVVLTLPTLVLGLRCLHDPRAATGWVALGLAGLGAVLAHGSAPAVVVVAVTAWACARLATGVRRGSFPERVGSAVAVLALPLLVGALALFLQLTVPQLASMGDFERISVDRLGEITETVQYAVPVPPLIGVQEPAWVLTALAAIGLIALVQTSSGRWMLGLAAILLVLRVLAAGPDGPLRDLTAIWYKDYDRLEALLVAPMAVIAGAGGAALIAILVAVVGSVTDRYRSGAAGRPGRGVPTSRRPTVAMRQASARSLPARLAAGAGVVAVVTAVAISTRGLHLAVSAETVRQGPRPAVPERPVMLPTGEAAWLRSLEGTLDDDALVLGSPASGAVLTPALAGWRVLPTELYPDPENPAVLALRSLERLGTDPAVCAELDRLGVTHLYLDAPEHMILGWSYPDPAAVPPDAVRTVAQHDDAMLVEVIAC